MKLCGEAWACSPAVIRQENTVGAIHQEPIVEQDLGYLWTISEQARSRTTQTRLNLQQLTSHPPARVEIERIQELAYCGRLSSNNLIDGRFSHIGYSSHKPIRSAR